MPSETQRIPPVPRAEWTDEVKGFFEFMLGPDAREEGSNFNIVMVLANHPELSKAMWKFHKRAMDLWQGSPQLREIVMLRLSWRNQTAYEWSHHCRSASEAGVTDEQIEACKEGPTAHLWSELERLTLLAADQLHDTSRIDDRTWAALARHFDIKQMMELVYLIAEYEMNCRAINAFRVEVEPDFFEPSVTLS